MSNQETPILHLGLVLAGGASAGAYSAGVMDFLIEALDAWEAQKKGGGPTPNHRVVIDVITGASAGAMTAAMSTVALTGQIEPMRSIDPMSDPGERNRLYDSWVKQIDIHELLKTQDLQPNGDLPPQIISVLDATQLELIANKALAIQAGGPERPYCADRLHVLFTVSNLRGVPYAFSLIGTKQRQFGMLCHADYMHFVLAKKNPGAEVPALYLDPTQRPNGEWPMLAQAAVASGAFPIGLRPRRLSQPKRHYDNRFKGVSPAFPNDLDDTFEFLNVDGGMIDNEPLDLARRVLREHAGVSTNEEHAGTHAILLIDPFPNDLKFATKYELDFRLSRVAPGILKALRNQVTFKPEELDAAAKPDIYTRFMISPAHSDRDDDDPVNALPSLAADILGGFGGFLAEEYRRHDFQLGRRNCQRFLSQHFRLPRENFLFDGWRDTLADEDAKQLAIHEDGKDYLPIIPVLGSASKEVPDPTPCRAGATDLDELTILMQARVRALGSLAIDTDLRPIIGESSVVRWAVRKFFETRMAPRIVEQARKHVEKELERLP